MKLRTLGVADLLDDDHLTLTTVKGQVVKDESF